MRAEGPLHRGERLARRTEPLRVGEGSGDGGIGDVVGEGKALQRRGASEAVAMRGKVDRTTHGGERVAARDGTSHLCHDVAQHRLDVGELRVVVQDGAVPGDDRRRAQGAQFRHRLGEGGGVRGRADQRDRKHHQVAGGDDALVREMHHEIAGAVSAPQVQEFDHARPLPQLEPVVDDDGGGDGHELRRVGQVARAEQGVGGEAGAFLVGDGGARRPLAAGEQAPEEADRAGERLDEVGALGRPCMDHRVARGAVRDELHAGEGVTIDLVPRDVVVVRVRVDHVAHRLVGQAAQRGEGGTRGGERELRVDHDDVALADDEEVVGFEEEAGGLAPDGCVDAVGELLDGEAGGGRRRLCDRSGRGEQRQQRQGERGAHAHEARMEKVPRRSSTGAHVASDRSVAPSAWCGLNGIARAAYGRGPWQGCRTASTVAVRATTGSLTRDWRRLHPHRKIPPLGSPFRALPSFPLRPNTP